MCHGGPFDFPADELPGRLERLLAVCDRLRPVAAATGVRFALENVMPGPATDLIRRAVRATERDAFGLCYDSAHDQIGGPRSLDLLSGMRDRLVAVHLSDRVRDLVDHVLPGDGFIDWPPVAALLRESTFGGPILLEVATTHSRVKEPRLFLASAHGRARALRDAIAGRAGGSPPDSRGAPSRPPAPGKLPDG